MSNADHGSSNRIWSIVRAFLIGLLVSSIASILGYLVLRSWVISRWVVPAIAASATCLSIVRFLKKRSNYHKLLDTLKQLQDWLDHVEHIISVRYQELSEAVKRIAAIYLDKEVLYYSRILEDIKHIREKLARAEQPRPNEKDLVRILEQVPWLLQSAGDSQVDELYWQLQSTLTRELRYSQTIEELRRIKQGIQTEADLIRKMLHKRHCSSTISYGLLAISLLMGVWVIGILLTMIVYWLSDMQHTKQIILVGALLCGIAVSTVYLLTNKDKYSSAKEKIAYFGGVCTIVTTLTYLLSLILP